MSKSPRFGVEHPLRYLCTNIVVWTGIATLTELLLQNGELADGVTLGVVGGGTYAVGNLLFKYKTATD